MTGTTPSDPARRPRGRPRSTGSSAAPNLVQALDRGLGLLATLAQEGSTSLGDLALEAGMPPSSAYRSLLTLQKHGLAEFDDGAQRWSVGIEAFRIGSAWLSRTDLQSVARAPMRALMEDTDETANLAVADGRHVVFVAQVEAPHPVRAFHAPGSRGHLHASGIGKALLATRDSSALEHVLVDGLQRFTERTLCDAGALRADLATTRERGWSLDDEERYAGMRCIAAPVFDAGGQAVAGVSISGPCARLPDARLATIGDRVVEAATAITIGLGGAVRELPTGP